MNNPELKTLTAQIGEMAQKLATSIEHNPADGLVQLTSLVANLAGAVNLMLSDEPTAEEKPSGKTRR